jgi:EPS-associated MarR family transcriptional regulator
MKNEDFLHLLISIKKNPKLSQREMSKNLGISLGKLNYCLKELKKKGLIKLANFRNNKNRFNINSKYNYLYILTPKGISAKTKLTISFMKKKLKEYDKLKKELAVKD